jgi:lipopolysaccharide/colanic/teichoic acid biosynthesis glycosyltransferase
MDIGIAVPRNTVQIAWSAAGKRLFDVVVGSILALLALPVIVVLAVAVAVTMRCWPFFVHERIGRGGAPFAFPKIRTLHPSTPRYTDKFSLEPSRTPRLCQALRRSHLDELPQLLLVPLGKLSLVGPRPKMPDAHEPVDWTYGKVRTSVRQGCTGLWQVGAHAHLEVRDSPEYDYFYVANGSLRLDLWILWRTVCNLAGAAEPVTLDRVPQWALGAGFSPSGVSDYIDLEAEALVAAEGDGSLAGVGPEEAVVGPLAAGLDAGPVVSSP